MKYRIKRLTMAEWVGADVVELPDGAIILNAESSRALPPLEPTNPEFRRVTKKWTITYLEPIKGKKK